MWAKKWYLVQPLTALTPKEVNFKWTYAEQKGFDETKQKVTHYALLIYPDFNKHFDIHTDARKLQLGAVISQDGKPTAFYSRKLTSLQKRYTKNGKLID